MAKRKTKTKKVVHDWELIVYNLQQKKRGSKTRIAMSSANVAQVTRCRLLDTYVGINATTLGDVLTIENTR